MPHRTLLILILVVAATTFVPAHAAAGSMPPWERALAIRSDGLNRTNHLGRYAIPRSLNAQSDRAWLRALEIRSNALNLRYHLGPYARASDDTGSGIGTADLTIASVVTASLLAIAAVAVRKRARLRPGTHSA
jgi:hypothetical protein